MTKPENIDSIMRRLNKLLALAEGNANEHESAAAAMQAAKIMERYRIEHTDLYLAKFQDDDEFDSVLVGGSTKTYKWVGFTATAVAKLLGVRVHSVQKYENGKKVKYIRFQGFKEDVKVAEWTFNYLCQNIKNAGEQYRIQNPGCGLSATNTFRQGMSIKISNRVNEYLEQQKRERSGTSSGTALEIAKDAAVTQRFGPNQFRRSRVSYRDEHAMNAGMDAGNKVDIFRRGLTRDNDSSTLALN